MSESGIEINHGNFGDLVLPKVIFKYRDWKSKHHDRFIINREVFMASARNFPDQTDCSNPTRFDLMNEQDILEYFLWTSRNENFDYTEDDHQKFAQHYLKNSRLNDPNFVEEFMTNMIDQRYDHEGILSLTENWNNDSMWDLYANEGKGFCIGYNSKILFSFLGSGGKVNYVDTMPTIMPKSMMDSFEGNIKRVYTKLEKYRFEDEYRTSKLWEHPASIEQRRIKLPKEAFNCIILGDNINKEDEKEIIYSTNKYIGDIKVIKRQNYNE